MQGFVNDIYDKFLNSSRVRASCGGGQVAPVAGGTVWSGAQALRSVWWTNSAACRKRCRPWQLKQALNRATVVHPSAEEEFLSCSIAFDESNDEIRNALRPAARQWPARKPDSTCPFR